MPRFRPPTNARGETQHLWIANCGSNAGGMSADRLRREVAALVLPKSAANVSPTPPPLQAVSVEVGKSHSYVSFKSSHDATRAADAIGAYFCGRKVRVAYAEIVNEVPPGRSSEHGIECTSATAHVCVPGLRLIQNFVSESEEAALISSIDGQTWSASVNRRRVQHYGHRFNYRTRSVDLDSALPIPDCLAPVLERVGRLEEYSARSDGASSRACVQNAQIGRSLLRVPDQVTVNEYPPGAGIAPHVDTHSAFEDGLLSLSLGSDCVMVLTRANRPSGKRNPGACLSGADGMLTAPPQHKAVLLPRRSLLILTGPARYGFSHGIGYRKHDMVDGTLRKRARRVSVTMRTVRMRPCLDCGFPACCDTQRGALA
jgi:alkylated DNA repair protein alkB family protein 8